MCGGHGRNMSSGNIIWDISCVGVDGLSWILFDLSYLSMFFLYEERGEKERKEGGRKGICNVLVGGW